MTLSVAFRAVALSLPGLQVLALVAELVTTSIDCVERHCDARESRRR